ncbi:hypothetical protein FEM03_12115 [Phragmitibacter flavus]|uniref:Uncharacterized protein n=1 Tax=Phragmitibacter flavus TaxID=2576071 RepID=A0A5R8KDY5_9BACT|nr:hypothetical protein [Phragmitibacter flavus]TLD70467.1 hypothetical protein FEM03_12115 [Phragmitibacter flavus]
MKLLFIYPLTCLFIIGMLSCQSMKAEGGMKEMISGDIFSGPEPAPVRPDNHLGPPRPTVPLRMSMNIGR